MVGRTAAKADCDGTDLLPIDVEAGAEINFGRTTDALSEVTIDEGTPLVVAPGLRSMAALFSRGALISVSYRLSETLVFAHDTRLS